MSKKAPGKNTVTNKARVGAMSTQDHKEPKAPTPTPATPTPAPTPTPPVPPAGNTPVDAQPKESERARLRPADQA